MTKEKIKKVIIPKFSYTDGWPDEGISEALKKPDWFRYSDLFTIRWYSKDLIEIQGSKYLIMKVKTK